MRSANLPQDGDRRQYHIGLAPGEVAESILLVGDPARAVRVSGLLDEIELERRNREYVTFTGRHRGLRVTVMATGMGADNTEIAAAPGYTTDADWLPYFDEPSSADVTDTYLSIRDPGETFLETYGRTGLAPFKEKLYAAH